MRFRAKFGSGFWLYMAMGCFLVVLWISHFHADVVASLAIAYTLMTFLKMLIRRLTYWELDRLCFRERRFGSVKEVPWETVERVGSIHPYVTIFCDGRAPMACQGGIVTNPKDRARFLAALYEFAPHAKFYVQ
jgi:hypothetical protein